MSALFQASKINHISVEHHSNLARQRKGLLRSTAIVAVAFVASMALAPLETSAQQYYDGADTTSNGALDTPPGVWDNAASNWADADGLANGNYNSAIATVFGAGNVVPATGGTVTVDAGGILLSPTVTFNATSNSSIYMLTGGDLQVDAGGTIFNVTDVTGTSAADAAIASSIVANGGAGVTKSGAGTLWLAGNGTFSGGLALNQGAVYLGTNTSAGTGAITTVAGTTIRFTDGLAFNTNGLNLANNVVLGGGGTTVFLTQTGTATISGVVSGSGNFLKSSTGTIVLSGANTLTGFTLVNAGVVNITGSVSSSLVQVTNPSSFVQVNGNSIGDNATVSLSNNGNLTLLASETIGTLSGFSGAVGLGANTLTLNTSGVASSAAVISGTGGIVKTGAGNQTLSGVNTYSGGTNVTGGTLTVGNAAALGAVTNDLQANGGNINLGGNSVTQRSLIVQFGGTVQTGTINLTLPGFFATQLVDGTISSAITGVGGLTKSNISTAALSGNNAYAGGTRLTAGTLIVGHNNALGTGVLEVTGAGATLQINNGIDIGNVADLQANTNFSVGTGNTGTYSGNIGETGSRTLTKTGTGNLILSGVNTYTGGTTVSGGTLTLASALAGNVTVANGGTLSLGLGGSVGGTITTTGSVIDYANGQNSAAPIILNSNTTQLQVLAGTATQSGAISQIGGLRPLEKIGVGTLVLSAANTYTGTTTVTAGTLDVTGSIGSSTVVVQGGATLQVDGASLNDFGIVTLNGNGILSLTGNEAIGILSSGSATSSVVLGTNTLTLNTSGIGSFAGVISGTGGLVKAGGALGTATLTGVNTFTGATSVNSGSLSVTGTGSLVSTVISTSATGSLNVDGSALAAGTVITNAGTFTVDAGDETITSINGAGNVALTNSGTLTLTGNSAIGGVLSGAASNSGITFSGGTSSLTNAGNTIAGNIVVSGAALTASAGSLGTGSASVLVSSGSLDLGTATHSVQALLVEAAGTLQDGIINVSGFFGTAGTINPNATVNTTSYALTATGGTINALTAGGINASNAGAINLAAGATAPAIVGAGDGINLDSTAAGNLTVTTGNAVNGGNNGIVLANAVGGNVLLTLGGNVTTPSGDAIQITSTVVGGTVRVTGTGNVTATGGVGSDGIQINSAGDTTVSINGNIEGDPGIVISSGAGNILVNGVGSVVGALQAMDLDTTTGNITVTQDATIASGIQGGTIGIDAQSSISGNIDISGIGIITGQANEGVFARTAGAGTILVNHNGVILGATDGVDVLTTGTGTVTVTVQQNITGTAGAGVTATTATGLNTVTGSGAISGGTFGINALATGAGGSVNISRTGTTTSTANGSTVINAQVIAGNGTVSVTQSSAISNTAAGVAASHGINATNVGTGSVSVHVGVVTLSAASTGTGINATSTGGGVITVSANAINGGAIGISASTTLGGTVTVAAGSIIGIGAPPTVNGIQTAAVNGVSLITLNGAVTAGVDGVNATSTGTGNIIITGNGNITGGAAVGSEGIQTSATSSATVISVNGVISANEGIETRASAGGDLSVTGTGNVTGSLSQGILALSNGGNGTVIVNRAGVISGASHGISALSRNGGFGTGTVTITAQQNVTSSLLAGVRARTDSGLLTVDGAGTISGATFGVDAQSLAAGGSVTVSGIGATTATGAASTTINAVSIVGNGNVSVTRSGFVSNTGTGATTGVNASATGSGTVTVTNQAGITVGGTGSTGIATSAVDGVTLITLNVSDVSSTGDGIRAASTSVVAGANAATAGSGGITIAGFGNVTGDSDGSNTAGEDGLDLTTAAGDISVTLVGAISGDPGIVATSTLGGDITIAGGGDVTGTLAEGILASTSGGNGVVNISRAGIILGATRGVDARSTNAGQTGTGTVTVDALQAITGQAGHGVFTRTDTATNTVTGVGEISGAENGIHALAREGGDVMITGIGATSSSGANGKAIRADAEDGNGSVTITRSGVITSSGAGGDGIDADVEGAGNINITSGIINLTNVASGSRAITANDNGPGTTGSITINSSGGAITVAGAGGDGIDARLIGAGNIDITNGAIALTNAGGGSRGVNVDHSGATTGNIIVNSNGTIAISGTAGTAFGIRTQSSTTGTTDINVSAAITLQDATNGAGIRVDNSNAAPGDITIDTTAAGVINGGQRGVRADQTGAASTGNIIVTLAGDVGNTDAPSREAVRTRTINGTNTVTGAGNFTGTTFGIDAQATTGAVLVSGAGNTSVVGVGASATGINALITGAASTNSVTVNRSGTVTVTGPGATMANTATGIIATNAGTLVTSNVAVTTGAAMIVDATTTATGIQATSASTAAGSTLMVTNGGTVTLNNGTTRTGIKTDAVAANTTVTVNAAINAGTAAGAGHGIDTDATGANATISITGNGSAVNGQDDGVNSRTVNGVNSVSSLGAVRGFGGDGVDISSALGFGYVGFITSIRGGANGILASATMQINVVNNGPITGDAQDGVNGSANTVDIGSNGAISGGDDGIQATTSTALNIQGNGTITGIAGHGINAISATGNVFIGNTGPNGNITGGLDGVHVAGGTGTVAVGQAGAASTVTGAQDGIEVDTTTGQIQILRAGLITGTTGDGINTASTGGGVITVSVGAVSGATSGITTSTTVGGTSAVTTGGLVSASAGTGISTNTAAGTNIITLGGNVTGTADGINATSTTGNITVTGAGNVTGGNAVGNDGIQTTTTTGTTLINVNGVISGDPGIVSSSTTGAITINGTGNVTGTAAEGILATSTAGGAVIINRTGIVSGATDGISATTTTGAITVTTGGNVSGASGAGIRVASSTGAATINIGAGHTVTGNTAAIISSAGSLTVNNLGTLSTIGGTASAFTVTAGSFALTNAGTAFGAIQSSAGTTTSFTNNAGATWSITNATSTLAGVSDTIQNDGTMISTGAVNFNGVEVFNNTSLNTFTVNGTTTIGPNVVFTNTGRISMQDGAIDDRLIINGTFIAAGSSTLDVDIDLSRNNPGGLQLSDILVLRGGPTSGATTVNFNVLAGTPTLQDAPIIVVDIDPTQANTGSFIDTNGTLPAAGNIIEYKLVQAANGDWVVNSVLNTAAIGSVSGSVQSTLSVIGAVVNRPSSPFVASPIAPDSDTCAPGTWGRGTGGRAVVDSKSGAPGAASRDAISTKIGYKGFQGGIDFGCFNIRGKGFDIATGVTGGFNNGTSSTRLPTSLTSSSFESQYIGGYASFQKGAFFADIQGRADYSDFKLNNSTVGLNNVKIKSERFSLTGTAAYSIEVPVGEESYNLVPAFGGSYAQSSTDTVMFADGSTLKLKDQTDILGFAGITVNRVFVTGGDEEDSDLSAYIPFATVTMYNEFGDTPSSVFTDSAGTQRIIDSQNLGLYAEFSAGVNYRKIFTSETSRIREIAASVRGDYKFGQRVQAVGITAQIRFQF